MFIDLIGNWMLQQNTMNVDTSGQQFTHSQAIHHVVNAQLTDARTVNILQDNDAMANAARRVDTKAPAAPAMRPGGRKPSDGSTDFSL